MIVFRSFTNNPLLGENPRSGTRFFFRARCEACGNTIINVDDTDKRVGLTTLVTKIIESWEKLIADYGDSFPARTAIDIEWSERHADR